MPPDQAAALKATADDNRRALRLSAKAERAAVAAAEAANAAGPSNITNNITNNIHFHAPVQVASAQPRLQTGAITDFFKRPRRE